MLCTVADTCLVLLFFSGISNALRMQGCANIRDVFYTLATRFKHLQRVLIINVFWTLRVWNSWNAFETFATRFEYYKRVLNFSNVPKRLKHLKRVWNIINAFEIFKTSFWNIINACETFATRLEYYKRVWNI